MAKETSSFQAPPDSRSRQVPGGQNPSTERPLAPPQSDLSGQDRGQALLFLSWPLVLWGGPCWRRLPPVLVGETAPEWLCGPRGDYPPDGDL